MALGGHGTVLSRILSFYVDFLFYFFKREYRVLKLRKFALCCLVTYRMLTVNRQDPGRTSFNVQ
jgi:hypothetical protein